MLNSTGKILAILFHPVFLFFYLIIGLALADNSLSSQWFQIIGIVFLVTVLIPVSFTWYTQKDLFLQNRRQRLLPLFFGSFCYLAAAWFLRNYGLPGFIFPFLIAIAVSSILLALISIKWKISMHANGMGCMAGLIIYYMPHNPASLELSALLVLIMLIVLSQRVLSKAHTIGQVVAGFLLGVTITIAALSIE